MEEPVIQVDVRESKPVFRLSNYRMVVHALLLTFISCVYGGVASIVLLVVGALMVYDNINRHALSIKASIPVLVLIVFFFVSLIANFITTMPLSLNSVLLFVSIVLYINIYSVCVMFNFGVVKEINNIDKGVLGKVLNIMSSALGFIAMPVTAYAVAHFIPSLELYTPLLFVFIHVATAPGGDDPILVSFATVITLIASIFSYLELEELYIILLPMSMYLLVLVPHLQFLSFIAVPLFIGSCVMVVTNNILFFVVSVIIAVILVFTLMHKPSVFECALLFVGIATLSIMTLAGSELNIVFIITMSVGVGLVAFRLRFDFEPLVFIPIICGVFTIFMYLHTAYHHIQFHITRFIVFNLSLHEFTVIYAGFASFTCVLPFIMTKVSRGVFSVMMVIYSFCLATIEYIVASRRNGVFYNDLYCVVTAAMLSGVGFLMFRTKRIYLTSFAVVLSIQIAKLSMFIFPRYLSIFSISVYLAIAIIRQSYRANVKVDFTYIVVNQLLNAVVSFAVSITFASTLHIIYTGVAPTFVQTLLEAAFLACVLATHECYVIKGWWFAVPFAGCFGTALAVLLSLGSSSSLDQLIIFFIVVGVIFTSSNKAYSMTTNFLTRFVFTVGLSVVFSHYLYGYLIIGPFWYYFILLAAAFCGIFLVMEIICVNKYTSKLFLPVYGALCVSLPLSFAGAVLITTNITYLRSIASVVFALHFTMHASISIALNISRKRVMKESKYNAIMSIVSGPWSILMGVFLHYFVLNGSSLAVLIFVPLIELLTVDKFTELQETTRSAMVVAGVIIGVPLLTVASVFKYGFNIYVFTTYLFVVAWNIGAVHFAIFLLKKKEVFPFPIVVATMQFIGSCVIMYFTTNDLMYTECVFALIYIPISVYMRLRKAEPKEDGLALD